MACQVPGRGSEAVDDSEVRCGPQPSPKHVERLVRQEHPGGAARDFSYSRLERWRVFSGNREVLGWRVVVDVTSGVAPAKRETDRHAYLIARRSHGFAILATGEGRPGSEGFAWSLRAVPPSSPEQPEQAELKRRRHAWARAQQVPTTDELANAEFGPPPVRYRQEILDHLRVAVGLSESARLRLLPPVKTWARRVGSNQTMFGWRVTAVVRADPVAARDRVLPYHFMFCNGQIVSTTRLGGGFQLLGEGEEPGPPPPQPTGRGRRAQPAK